MREWLWKMRRDEKAGQALIEWDNPRCDDHRCGNGHSRAGSLPSQYHYRAANSLYPMTWRHAKQPYIERLCST